MGPCLSCDPAVVDEPIPGAENRILKYSIIRLVRKLVDMACVLYKADAACVVSDNAVITDSGHDDPSWIDCWQAVLSDMVIGPAGCWQEHQPASTLSGLNIAWLAAVRLDDGLGYLLVKGSAPADVNCLPHLQSYAHVVSEEFRLAFSGSACTEARFIVDTSHQDWNILWVNSYWASLTEVSNGRFWTKFSKLQDIVTRVTVAAVHRPLLHLTLRFDKRCSPYHYLVGRLATVYDNEVVGESDMTQNLTAEAVFHVSFISDERDGEFVRRAVWCSQDVAVKQVLVEPGVSFMPTVEALQNSCVDGHPNIVQVLGANAKTTDDGRNQVWIITEWINGSTLRVCIEQGYFRTDDNTPDYYKVLHTAKQIVAGLCHLHKKGFVHGNMHTGNVMVSSERTVKVTDYGISEIQEEIKMTTYHKSIAHMAPEQLLGAKVYFKTDVYAFGIAVCEMLIGGPCWADMNAGSVVARKCANERPELPMCTPEPLASLLNSCTTFHQTDRPSWEDVTVQLDSLLDHILAM